MSVTTRSALSPMSILRFVFKQFALFGVDAHKMYALRKLPRYFADRGAFVRAGGAISDTFPVLEDYSAQAGSASGHYFHQDLLVARSVFLAKPIRHVDVGSRIDGFVAHVASFRQIDVFDIRPLAALPHENISFVRGNLMDLDPTLVSTSDSVSCLHALEHFGLGRYGDPIDPQGHLKGFENLYKMLSVGGVLYLSVPIGVASVHFNAHRVFNSDEVPSWCAGKFQVERFDYVDDTGALHRNATYPVLGLKYGCGIYTLTKITDSR